LWWYWCKWRAYGLEEERCFKASSSNFDSSYFCPIFLHSCTKTYWKSLSWGRNFPLHLKNPKVYCHVHRGVPTVPLVSHMNSVHISYNVSLDSFLIWSSDLFLHLLSGFFLSFRYCFCSFIFISQYNFYVTWHAHPIFLDIMTLQISVKITDYKSLHYAVSCILPVLPFLVTVILLNIHSQTPSFYVIPLRWNRIAINMYLHSHKAPIM